MDSETIRRICAGGEDLDVYNLSKPRVFDMALADLNGKQVKPICSKEVFINIELHICHGLALKLRKVKWLITDQRDRKPFLRRPIANI